MSRQQSACGAYQMHKYQHRDQAHSLVLFCGKTGAALSTADIQADIFQPYFMQLILPPLLRRVKGAGRRRPLTGAKAGDNIYAASSNQQR